MIAIRTVRAIRTLTTAVCILLCNVGMAVDEDDFLRDSVLRSLRESDVTAHIRILRVRMLETESAGSAAGGYQLFEVTAQLLESFHGNVPAQIAFCEVQERGLDPPTAGEFIVGLKADGRNCPFDDDMELWIPATSELISAARSGE